MVDSSATKKLARAFPNSFINSALEFIAHEKTIKFINSCYDMTIFSDKQGGANDEICD